MNNGQILQLDLNNKMNYYSSNLPEYSKVTYRTINPQVEKDELKYLKLGEQRQKLKTYVQEQLNGEETRRNERILLKFQEEAQVRRHNYLHKFNPNTPTNNQIPQHSINMAYNSNLHNPQLQLPNQHVTYKSRFANYMPGLKQRNLHSPPLVPTQKRKPPAYNYYNVLPHRSFDERNQMKRIYNSQTIEPTKGESFGTPEKYAKRSYPKHSRAMSLDLNGSPKDCHRSWALKKIKEVALKKRDPPTHNNNPNERQKEETNECSQGSSIISQLQRRHIESMMDCERMARQLKKMKKYRRFIVEQQSRLKTKPT